MISKIVRRRIEMAGLLPFVEDRSFAIAALGAEARSVVEQADSIALGAAADLVRRKECDTVVRLYAPSAVRGDAVTVSEAAGVVRRVAAMRLLLPAGTRIAVDCDSAGLKIALLALGFGANDLVGSIPPERRREVEREVSRLGYGLVFVDAPQRAFTGASSVSAAEGA
jgi:hypothetical protein